MINFKITAATTYERVLNIFYLFLGSFAIIIQTILLRETFIVSHGNEFSFGLVFGLWLIGIFSGSFIGSKIADKTKNPLLLVSIFVSFLFLISIFSIVLTRILFTVVSASIEIYYVNFFKLLFSASLFIIPVSFTIGILFPLGTNLKTTKTHKNMTKIYIFEAIGSMFSGILYTFLFSHTFNPFLTISIFSFPLFICLLLLLKGKKISTKIYLLIPLLINIVFFFPQTNSKIQETTLNVRWQSISNSKLLHHSQSMYHDIAVGEKNDLFFLYINGKLHKTFPEKYSNFLTAIMLFSQHKNLNEILIIGDSAFELSKELLLLKKTNIKSLEMDREISRILKTFQPNLKPTEHTIYNMDQRLFFKKHKKENDLIFLSTPPPSTLLNNRTYTIEFFTKLKKILHKDGVIALDLQNASNYLKGIRGEYSSVIYHTLKSVFPEVIITSGYKRMIFASQTKINLSNSYEILRNRLNKSNLENKNSVKILIDFYNLENMKTIRKQLESFKINNLNSNERPLSVFLFNQIEGWNTNTNIEKIFTLFSKLNFNLLFYFLVLLTVIILVKRLYFTKNNSIRLSKYALFSSVFVTGLVSISLHLLLIYKFQNSIGYTYQMIGFLSAIFMAGLPLGTVIANRIILKYKNSSNIPPILIASAQLMLILISLTISLSTKLQLSLFFEVSIIFISILITGICTGTIYPPFSKIFLTLKNGSGKISGSFYALDHLGASLGAIFVSIFFLPLHGFIFTCNLLIVLLLFSFCFLTISFFKKVGIKK